jgi:sugar phosphate isomerase/epimerase
MSLSALPLSYCTNVHPAHSLNDVEQMLDRYTVPIQRSLGRPVAAGLWLPKPVIDELDSPDAISRLSDFLRNRNLSCYTLNAFPFGDFHADRVKEQVYLPDWTDRRRLEYTIQCAKVLAALLPEGVDGSISTLPLGFKPFNQPPEFLDACAETILQAALMLGYLAHETGKLIRLAIEPEPFCHLETTTEAIDFFKRLWSMAEQVDFADGIRDTLGLCYDICHQAVEFEDIPASVRAIDAAGIRINKVHVSCAIELSDVNQRTALASYIEPRYLHQTLARGGDGQIAKAVDLDEQLLRSPPPDFASAEKWRVHFHVPVSAERLGILNTTRSSIPQALAAVAKLDYAPHLEVETYTWNVLPGEPLDFVSGIADELRTTYQLIGSVRE